VALLERGAQLLAFSIIKDACDDECNREWMLKKSL
jgi:hypothetical protein